jgi:EAL domain-containing protein (putative c-di-GMP-specific phosphodiesterase class I)
MADVWNSMHWSGTLRIADTDWQVRAVPTVGGLAEETGLIVALAEWVLRRACEDAASWPSHARVAVNLSPVQLKST